MKRNILFLLAVLFLHTCMAQLAIQGGAKLNIQAPAIVAATGHVGSSSAILGSGTLLLNGSSLQELGLNGSSAANISVQNPSNVSLTSAAQINGLLKFLAGKIITGNNILTLGPSSSVSGAGAGRFVETSGTGQLKKTLTAAATDFLLPVGNGNDYTPLIFSATGTFSNASVGVACKPTADPNKPAGAVSYLNAYWKVQRTGITGGVSAIASYVTSNIVGNEAACEGYFWTGTSWTKSGASIDRAANQVTAMINGPGGDIYAMNDIATATRSTKSGFMDEGVYPNPTASQSVVSFTMDIAEAALITVSDAHGSVALSEKVFLNQGLQQRAIDLSGFPSGVYKVAVATKSATKYFTIIKSR